MEVLKQRILQHVLARRGAHDRRNRCEAGLASSAPPTLTHNEFVAVVGWGHNYRLQNSDRPDRLREFGQFFLVKHFTRLARVRRDLIHGDELEPRASNTFVYRVAVSTSVINALFVIIIEIRTLKKFSETPP